MCTYKLLPIINSNFLFIIFIIYPILSILTLFIYQALLASLLGIIGNINSYSIVLNATQLFSISFKMREYLGNIVVKNIKGMPLLKLKLLKL